MAAAQLQHAIGHPRGGARLAARAGALLGRLDADLLGIDLRGLERRLEPFRHPLSGAGPTLRIPEAPSRPRASRRPGAR